MLNNCMIKFSMWLEARNKKKDDSALSLWDFPQPQEPAPEPEEATPSLSRQDVLHQQRQKKDDRNANLRGSGIRAPKVIPVRKLLMRNLEDKSKMFIIKSFGRTIDVGDLHPMWDNGRIVGHDKQGHRYLVARDAAANVLVYPDYTKKMPLDQIGP